jgi:hypothetical protein
MKGLTECAPLPEAVVKWFSIKLLGEPFAEAHRENGRLVIKRGYLFEGKKYYETTVFDSERKNEL